MKPFAAALAPLAAAIALAGCVTLPDTHPLTGTDWQLVAIDTDKFVWVVVGDATKVRAQLEPLGLPIEQREMEGE